MWWWWDWTAVEDCLVRGSTVTELVESVDDKKTSSGREGQTGLVSCRNFVPDNQSRKGDTLLVEAAAAAWHVAASEAVPSTTTTTSIHLFGIRRDTRDTSFLDGRIIVTTMCRCLCVHIRTRAFVATT
jgi:hypothetical protein